MHLRRQIVFEYLIEENAHPMVGVQGYVVASHPQYLMVEFLMVQGPAIPTNLLRLEWAKLAAQFCHVKAVALEISVGLEGLPLL